MLPLEKIQRICEDLLGKKLGCYVCSKPFMKQHSSHVCCSKECADELESRIPRGYPWDNAYEDLLS